MDQSKTDQKTQYPLLICSLCHKDIPFLSFEVDRGKMKIIEKCSCQNEASTSYAEEFMKKLKESSTLKNSTENPQITCNEHKKAFTSYCRQCTLNLCIDCLPKHENHLCVELKSFDIKTIHLDEIPIDLEKEIIEKKQYHEEMMNELNAKISRLTEELNECTTLRDNIINLHEHYCSTNRALAELINSINATIEHFPCYQMIDIFASMPYEIPKLENIFMQYDATPKVKQLQLYKHIIPGNDVSNRSFSTTIFEYGIYFANHNGTQLFILHKNNLYSFNIFGNSLRMKEESQATIKKYKLLFNGLIALVHDYEIEFINPSTLNCDKKLEGQSDLLYEFKDKRILTQCYNSNNMKLWNTSTFECIGTLTGLKGSKACEELKDGKLLITYQSHENDGFIELWDLTTCTLKGTINTGPNLEFTHPLDTNRLLTCHRDSQIKIWNLQTMKCQATEDKFEGRPTFIAFKNDKIILEASNKLVSWNIATSKFENENEREMYVRITKNKYHVVNESLVVIHDKDIAFLSLEDLAIVKEIKCDENVSEILLLNVDKHLLSIDTKGNIAIWDMKTYECMKTMKANQAYDYHLMYLNDYQFCVISTDFVQIWNI